MRGDGKARRESNPRPLDYQSVTPLHRPGGPDEGRRGKRSATELRAFPSFRAMEPAGLEPATSRSQVDNPPPSARETRTRVGEGVSALPAELRPPACRAVLRVGGAAERSALAPGVACPRASGSAPAGHPVKCLAAPSSSATSSSRGEPANEDRPTRPVRGWGDRVAPRLRKGSGAQGAHPPGTPALVVLPSFPPSCRGRPMPPRPKRYGAPKPLLAPHERTSAPRRPAHAGHAAGDAGPASCRGLPASLSSERACIGAVSSVRGVGVAGRTRRKRKIAPPMSSRSLGSGTHFGARGVHGAVVDGGTSGRDSLEATSVIARLAAVKGFVRRTGRRRALRASS